MEEPESCISTTLQSSEVPECLQSCWTRPFPSPRGAWGTLFVPFLFPFCLFGSRRMRLRFNIFQQCRIPADRGDSSSDPLADDEISSVENLSEL